MSAVAEQAVKPFLTLSEFASYIGRSYSTVWEWVNDGRIPTEQRRGKKKTTHRVSAETAAKAKKRLEDGLWV
jgi:predicted DNA-binding transcriptional regulator AlpA